VVTSRNTLILIHVSNFDEFLLIKTFDACFVCNTTLEIRVSKCRDVMKWDFNVAGTLRIQIAKVVMLASHLLCGSVEKLTAAPGRTRVSFENDLTLARVRVRSRNARAQPD